MPSHSVYTSSSRSAPLLQQPSSHSSFQSLDKMDVFGGSGNGTGASASASASPSHLLQSQQSQQQLQQQLLARPRPEIILRWKRFALLVLLSATLISAVTVTLWIGIPLDGDVDPDDAERLVEMFNSYSGVVMGFAESAVGVLLGYLFPVFIVYLHNLKWSRADDPATRMISKTKKVALLLFFPVVMIAIGNSLSAVQTNQSGGSTTSSTTSATRDRRLQVESSSSTATSAIDDTPLRSVVRGHTEPMAAMRASATLGLDRVAAATRVALGFKLPAWASELLPDHQEMDAQVQLQLRLSDHKDRELMARADGIVSAATANGLLRQGVATFRHFVQQTTTGMQTTEIPFTQPQPQATTSRKATMGDVLTAASAAFNTSDIHFQVQRKQLHAQISMELLTVEIALLPSTPQSVATIHCGAESCVAVSSDPLTRLRSLVTVSQFEATATPATCNAAFLYGSSLSAVRDQSDTAQYRLQLTFAKLSWDFSSKTNSDDVASPHDTLTFPLRQPQRHHLVLTASRLPLIPPPTSLPLRLLEIVQPPLVVTTQSRLASATLLTSTDRPSSPEMTTTAIHGSEIDAFTTFLRTNRLATITPATLHATALLFLFQHAALPSPLPATVAISRHLTQAATSKDEVHIYVTNTRFGAIATWIACGILFILSTLVLVFPNARARLEPPKGGNARAERFIAVQTEEVYPNLVYKKRFRIGKTGEKIKFREFGVDAVTLHHKMEEDEQIYL